ncbi:MAG: TonB family protein [Bryobacteraceae bacterium]
MEWKQWEGHVVEGRFHLGQYLGGSAHSAVFVTECGEGTPQKAAIKLVPADSAAAQVWMLRRELAARLSHPGLLSIYHFGTCQLDGVGLVYVVMERSEEDLSQVIPSRPLAAAEAREMLTDVLETLAYLHAEGFVHGCLTPTNIMAVGDRVKISSDGLLRSGESGDDLWARNVNGPPEGHTGIMPAGDVWSLGMTVVQVLTQWLPVWDGSATNDPIVPESLEAPFLDIARRSLRSDPRLRCSLADIALALQPASAAPQASPNVAKVVPIAQLSLPERARRSPYFLPVGGAILGGMILAGAILTGTRLLNSPSATAPRPVASEQAVVPEKPETAAAEPAAGPVAAPEAAETPEAQTPPSPAPPAPVKNNSAGTLPAAAVVDRFVPEVPPSILGTIRGMVTVRVRVTVDQSGAVVDAVLDSRPGSKYFDRVALEAARRWKFQPASDAGQNVEGTRLLRFEFRRDGCKASDQAH